MAERIEIAAAKARESDGRAIGQARQRFDDAAHCMERLTGTVATIQDQHRHLLWAVGGGLFGGILSLPQS